MKIFVEDVEIISERFESWDAIFNKISPQERDQDGVRPKYSFETFALVLLGWCLKKCGDELVRLYLDSREEAQRQRDKDVEQTLERKRHNELIQKMEELISVQKNQYFGITEEQLKSWIKNNKLSVAVVLETDTEHDFSVEFQDCGLNVRPD